jgi:uncharacterized protein YlaI
MPVKTYSCQQCNICVGSGRLDGGHSHFPPLNAAAEQNPVASLAA